MRYTALCLSATMVFAMEINNQSMSRIDHELQNILVSNDEKLRKQRVHGLIEQYREYIWKRYDELKVQKKQEEIQQEVLKQEEIYGIDDNEKKIDLQHLVSDSSAFFNEKGLTNIVHLENLPQNVNQLWLSDNQLRELPDVFNELTSLKELYLHGNPLTKLPPSLVSLTNLTQLVVSNAQNPVKLTKLENCSLKLLIDLKNLKKSIQIHVSKDSFSDFVRYELQGRLLQLQDWLYFRNNAPTPPEFENFFKELNKCKCCRFAKLFKWNF